MNIWDEAMALVEVGRARGWVRVSLPTHPTKPSLEQRKSARREYNHNLYVKRRDHFRALGLRSDGERLKMTGASRNMAEYMRQWRKKRNERKPS